MSSDNSNDGALGFLLIAIIIFIGIPYYFYHKIDNLEKDIKIMHTIIDEQSYQINELNDTVENLQSDVEDVQNNHG